MTDAATAVRERREAYRCAVRFSGQPMAWQADETPPLGAGEGPSPVQLLLAAVGDRMGSSQLFALGNFHNDPRGLTTTAQTRVGRNEAGRLRVLAISQEIRLGAAARERQRLDRILGQFDDLCAVGHSVRAGLPIDLAVFDGEVSGPGGRRPVPGSRSRCTRRR